MKPLVVGAMLLQSINAQIVPAAGGADTAPAPFPAVPPASIPAVQPSPIPAVRPSPLPAVQPASIPAVRPAPIPAVQPGSIPSVQPAPIPAVRPSSLPAVRPSSIPAVKSAPIPAVRPAPILTPGADAPSETDLALGTPDIIPSLPVLPKFPTGTADVVLDQPTPVAPFGAGSTPATNAFVIPPQPPALDAESIGGAAAGFVGTPIPQSTPKTAPAAPLPQQASPDLFPSAPVRGTPKVGSFGSFALPGDAAAPPADAAVPDTTAVDSAVAEPLVTDSGGAIVLEGSASAGAVLTSSPSSSAIIDADPVKAAGSAVTPTPLAKIAALALGSNFYPPPFDLSSIYDPNSPYYDPYAQPPGWEGEDNGIYDGEDDYYPGGKRGSKPGYGYDDENEECPAWCLPEDDSYDPYPTSTPDYDYSPYQPTQTPEYPDYEPVADPYPEYEKTPEYTPYPKEYPTPSPKYAADPYQEEPYPEPTPDYEAEPQYYPQPKRKSYPQLNKVRSILRAVRRQVFNWPQPTYPQPIYSDDDDDSGAYDGEDGSIPDWLYDISGAPKKPTPAPKPKCPKSCYKHKTDGYGTKPERPTYTKTRKGGYKTTEDPYKTTEDPYKTTEDPYYPEPTKDGYYGDGTADAPYAPGYTSSAWYPQGNSSALYWPTGPTNVPDVSTSIPDEPTSIPDGSTSVPSEPTSVPSEPTVAPYEPTTLVTQYQPQPYPEQTGGYWSDPGSPAGDYTGDTLDTLCPNTCNPFNPAENFCDITTGCTTTGGSKYYCACRAGFRADNFNAKDFSKQFKVAGQPYVYLAVSTSCNTPCSDQTCSEVLERSQCK